MSRTASRFVFRCLFWATVVGFLCRRTSATRWIPVLQTGDIPPALDLPSQVFVPQRNETLLIGGFDTTNKGFGNYFPAKNSSGISAYSSTFSIRSGTTRDGTPQWVWKNLAPSQFAVDAGGSSAAITDDGNMVVRWGGVQMDATQNPLLSTVHTMNFTGEAWGAWVPMQTTNTPLLSAFAKAVIYGDLFITVGGIDADGAVNNAINKLSLRTGTWSTMSVIGENLPASWGHNVVLWRNFPLRDAVVPNGNGMAPAESSDVLLIIGGQVCPSDTRAAGPSCFIKYPGYALDLATETLHLLDTKGTSPGYRAQATAQLVLQPDGEYALSLTGGYYGDSTYVYWFWSDNWLYTPTSRVWSNTPIANPSTFPNRYGAFCVPPFATVGFGSTFPYSVHTDAWALVTSGGDTSQSSLNLSGGGLVVSVTGVEYILTMRDSRGLELGYGGETVMGFLVDEYGRTTIGVVDDHGNGTYTIAFQASWAGAHDLYVNYNGASMFASTSVKVRVLPGAADPSTSSVTFATELYQGVNASLALDVRDFTGNTLLQNDALMATTVLIAYTQSSQYQVPGFRREPTEAQLGYVDGQVIATFVPESLGNLTVTVFLNGMYLSNAVIPVNKPIERAYVLVII
ncbi:uncharacterized protein EV422DRAFT_348934 [Fimicolochytrium jonesii]|uniref:uncharacterized protein n=1 Tax=Fimicolochytrium jonesii TaxID=1396493 RepID=UPI0022FDFAD0|nr:uncharacterized protein EV422DRAFT_348934 [Fimicolochytrium jonesii]KAI8815682.1 hypothetical protein EV422DRAFT_348934 [Fimicolochytrium jonesii]